MSDLEAILAAALREAAQAAADAARAAHLATNEGLAVLEPARRRVWGTRPARMRAFGRGVRLGTLVLQTSSVEPRESEVIALWSAGETLRTHDPPAVLGYTSASARARDVMRASAIRGGYEEGEIVHYGLVPLDAAGLTDSRDGTGGTTVSGAAAMAMGGVTAVSGRGVPIGVRDGVPVVPWRPGAPLTSAPTVRDYLLERIALQSRPTDS